MKRAQEILEQLKGLLPPERFAHSKRVVETALELAAHYHVDCDKVRLAALLHDCARYLAPGEMLKKAESLGFTIDKVQRVEPKLLHADLSAYYTEHTFGIKDPEVLSAIRSHTVGNTNMSLMDKIVYLADHIEAVRDYRGLKKVKALAFKNLDEAVIESLNSMIRFLETQGKPVYIKTLQTRDSLKNG